MINLEPLIIARLKTQFADVEGLTELAELGDRNVSRQTLFVIEMAESPAPLIEGTGLMRHRIGNSYGVLLVTPARNNQRPDITADRQQIRDLLFGWAPHEDYEPFSLGNGGLQPSRKGVIAWLSRFNTQYTEDAIGVS
ncbi:hypothetical protein JYB87_12770 [Shewanella avicenniae]|uniref:Uncharacterized protein n=1 Tax=Shewanella avicenniae TaxID=2814294 RepID=A0ABX7QNV5_9GAMM|nr:hypothetical protein [Shewanella avicenniae]QSX32621.1 hypothetical protein JYB87_12770 [Shewanella avicenniae]